MFGLQTQIFFLVLIKIGKLIFSSQEALHKAGSGEYLLELSVISCVLA